MNRRFPICPALGVLAVLVEPTAAWSSNGSLRSGKILVYDQATNTCKGRQIVVKAVIEAPPEKVWPLVDRCGDYKRVMPRVKRSKELSRKGSHVVCTMTIDMPFPYSDVTSVTNSEHVTTASRWLRRWRLRSGDYNHLHGSWELRRFEGSRQRTLMVYRNCAEPKSWVPGWIRRWAQKKMMPEMVENIRRTVRRR